MKVRKNKKNFQLCITLSILTVISLIYFITNFTNIKKDTYTAVFGVDLISYYTAAKLMGTGEISEIYAEVNEDFSAVNSGRFFETAKDSGFKFTPTRFVYMPVFLAPFNLLTGLSFSAAADLWLMLNLMIITAVIVLQWHLTRGMLTPALRAMVVISVNLVSFPLFYALKLGQTTLLIYLAVCLVYYCVQKDKNTAAGILLGLIVSMKYSPLLFVIYFLYRKKYRLVISCLTTTAVLIILSITLYGLPLNKMYWHYLTDLSGIGIAGWSNQSLYALLLRQFTSANALLFNPVTAGLWISLLRYGVALAIVTAMFHLFSRCRDENIKPLYPLEFSAMILCILIISPVTWLHYLSLTGLSFIIIIAFCLKKESLMQTPAVIFTSITGYCLVVFHPDYHRLLAVTGQNCFSKLIISLPFFGTCLLLTTNLWLIKKTIGNYP